MVSKCKKTVLHNFDVHASSRLEPPGTTNLSHFPDCRRNFYEGVLDHISHKGRLCAELYLALRGRCKTSLYPTLDRAVRRYRERCPRQLYRRFCCSLPPRHSRKVDLRQDIIKSFRTYFLKKCLFLY